MEIPRSCTQKKTEILAIKINDINEILEEMLVSYLAGFGKDK